MANRISKALDLFNAGDQAGALAALVTLWGRHSHPDIADLTEAVSQRVCENHPTTIAGKNRAERLEAWHRIEATQSAVALPSLLEAVPTMTCRNARDMLAKLLKWPRDPRFTTPLLELVKAPPRGYQGQSSGGFWQRHGTLLARVADVRALQTVESIMADCAATDGYAALDGFMVGALERAANGIRKREASGKCSGPLEAALEESRQKFLKLVRRPAVDLTNVRALYAAVYENPRDLSHRAVLGDALSEAGDPRGEFIVLQLRALAGGPVNGAQKRRMSSLLKEHADDWLGTLKGVVLKTGRVFEGGFLTEARIETNQERVALGVIGALEWATVKRLHVGIWPTEATELVKHPIMRSLESVTGA